MKLVKVSLSIIYLSWPTLLPSAQYLPYLCIHTALLQQFAASSDLEHIFSNPDHVRRLIDGVPFFKALSGVEDIRTKGDQITADDVSQSQSPIMSFLHMMMMTMVMVVMMMKSTTGLDITREHENVFWCNK